MKTRRSFSRGLRLAAGAALVAWAAALAGQTFRGARAQDKPTPEKTEQKAGAAKQVKIDLGRAVKVSLPAGRGELTPVPFRTDDGRSGWVVRVPGGRPLATPAYAGGMLFLGGGYGSHDFYAFDARTGRLVWKTQTSDDGPTAAVVADGYVAFNTESCTLIVVDAKTGKLVWQEWLGDPLMSQPAVSQGRVYMAYPGGQRGHAGQLSANPVQSAAANQQQKTPAQGGHAAVQGSPQGAASGV